MNIETLREVVSRLNSSASALAALGAALDARVTGSPLDPAVETQVDDVVAALGVREALGAATQAELKPLLGEIRAFALTSAKLLLAGSRAAGWGHTEAEILQAAGDVSTAFPHVLARAIAPALEGLAGRLGSPGASFLDVGAGVAALSVEMARLWPSLRVVGIEPWAPSLALAHERVREAGLEARIELRNQAGQDLPDRDAFDLAWIPSVFIPEEVVPLIVQRVHRALRPGGWLLFPMMRAGGDALAASLTRLRAALFGGLVTTTEKVEALLREAGFVDVRTLPGAPTALTAMIAARKPLPFM